MAGFEWERGKGKKQRAQNRDRGAVVGRECSGKDVSRGGAFLQPSKEFLHPSEEFLQLSEEFLQPSEEFFQPSGEFLHVALLFL
jgi:hypothetical protein